MLETYFPLQQSHISILLDSCLFLSSADSANFSNPPNKISWLLHPVTQGNPAHTLLSAA
jgi:hypothetical protein